MIENETIWEKRLVLLILVILFFLAIRYNVNDHAKHKRTYDSETIGLATRIKSYGKTSSLRYYFYAGNKVISEISCRDYSLTDKFYKVKYDLKNPEKNEIILEEELVPDSITLVKAGFTKTKYYVYDDGVTCKYIEKEKWK